MRHEKSLDINDFVMSYYEEGEGECVIFLHGNGMNSTQFSKLYNNLKRSKRCIAVDVRGSGKSTRGKKKLTMNQITLDLIEFLKCKEISKVDIVGYSDGANIAMLLAKKKPELIKKLVLIVGNYKLDGICGWFKFLLIIYKALLKFGSNFSQKMKIRLELAQLMFEDIELEDSDLENFDMETLVMYSGIDVIKKSHSEKIGELIKNSDVVLVKNSTHENIIRKKEAIDKIVKFLA